MKKFFIIFVVGVIFSGFCSAQNANAQGENVEQKIIGTWVNNKDGTRWVFNTNGTLSIRDTRGGGRNDGQYNFCITNLYLAVIRTDMESTQYDRAYSISMSSDGNNLICALGSSCVLLTRMNQE